MDLKVISKINAMPTMEEIKESKEEIQEETQAIVTSAVKPRLRILTRDSAYDSSENLHHLSSELKNLEISKEDIQDENVGDPTETTEKWSKISDNINKDLQHQNFLLNKAIEDKEEKLAKIENEKENLQISNKSLKEECERLEKNLKLTNMQLEIANRANITFEGLEKDKEILQKKNEELNVENSKMSEDLRKMKSNLENNEILLINNEELIIEKNNLSENLMKMKSEFAEKERDFDRKIEEILKQKTEVLLNEKEKEFAEKVKSLEPILHEALEFNEGLKYQVKYLEEAIKEKDKNLLIFLDRNHQSEVRLSKTRRYIQHREREFN